MATPPRLLGVAVGLVVVIVVLAPHYNEAQTAGAAAAFRDVVGDDRGRFTAAAVVDIAFAAAYASLAWSIAGRIGGRIGAARTARRLARWGAAAVTVGAVCDVVENVLVIRGIDRWEGLDDGVVDAMVRFGAGKWAFAVLGIVLTLVAWALDRRRQPANASS